MKNDVWIGLVGIRSTMKNTILGNRPGAYTNILLLANNQNDYIDKVNQFLQEKGIEAFEFEDIDVFSNRVKNFEVEEKLHYLAEIVIRKQQPQIGTLHTFDEFA